MNNMRMILIGSLASLIAGAATIVAAAAVFSFRRVFDKATDTAMGFDETNRLKDMQRKLNRSLKC